MLILWVAFGPELGPPAPVRDDPGAPGTLLGDAQLLEGTPGPDPPPFPRADDKPSERFRKLPGPLTPDNLLSGPDGDDDDDDDDDDGVVDDDDGGDGGDGCGGGGDGGGGGGDDDDRNPPSRPSQILRSGSVVEASWGHRGASSERF